MKKLVVKKIEDKNVVWFKNSNSYLVLEPLVTEILLKINKNVSLEEIETWTSEKTASAIDIIKKFIKDIYSLYLESNKITKETSEEYTDYKTPTKYYSEKQYSIKNSIFIFQFENEYLESQIHSIFAHLEIKNQPNFHFNYQIFEHQNSILFVKNKKLIGGWKKEEVHIFQGKISMHLLIDSYKKLEENWMGVFHASAISNGKESMLFLGDSGNGKSTSLALLNANGFDCIADDFVPIDNDKNVYTYPAAISIKKKSIKTLLPFYPELENTTEHHLKKLNKIVRYLPPKNINYDLKLKCKALVFIKYKPKVELEIKSISKIDAFQQLIPDSWISPIEKNATAFLDWFLELPTYQLTYSDNSKMIETVSKIFNNEL
ncbi:MAG: hypothetical protein V3U80_05865 [Flavobacteriaceae bacterium]|jgi:hypothetical protein